MQKPLLGSICATRISTVFNPVAGTCGRETGLTKTLGELATVLGAVSLIVCQYFKFSDLFEEISAIAGTVDNESERE